RFLCANGHPLKEGQKFCAVCGAGVFSGERAPARRKRFLPIAIGSVTLLLVFAVIGAATGGTNTSTPKAAPAAASVETVTTTPSPSSTPRSTPAPTHKSTPKPVATVKKVTPALAPAPKKTTKPPTGVNGNPWGY